MEDSLVSRRSKRSTAGNRMEAALAEIGIDDLMKDIDEDVDFVSKADEEDVFESDFASTDEEAGQDDEDTNERTLQEEERRAKQATRQRTYRIPRPPARKVTFNSLTLDGEEVTAIVKPKTKLARRVSLGQAVDAETGEVLKTNKRQSKREATRINTQELQSRLKTAEGRRASLMKRPKEIERRKTQAELINAALDMEEHNIKSHREYLVNEEERRKKARIVKASTIGPKVRWRSHVEEITVNAYDPVLVPQQTQRPTWTSPYTTSMPTQPHSGPHNPPLEHPSSAPSGAVQPPQLPPTSQHLHGYVPVPTTSNHASNAPSSKPTSLTNPHYINQYNPYQYYTPTAQRQLQHSQYQQYGQYYAYQSPTHLQLHPQISQLSGLVPRRTTEKQVKNYVEHLVDEEYPHNKPKWRESMDAFFGTHADWDNVKVYVGKNRPIARLIQTCPITGLQARYRDPRTGVPYANAGAFRILTRLLEHEYVWSPFGAPGDTGVFIGHEKQRGASGVPGGWGEAMAGAEDGWRKKRADGKREEKAKDKDKEKEIRVGERRSSRIAGDGSEQEAPHSNHDQSAIIADSNLQES